MITPELLKIIACPETKQPLALGSDEELDKVNRKIKAGSLNNHSGVKLDSPLDGVLITADRQIAYPISGGIPVLLVDESFVWEE